MALADVLAFDGDISIARGTLIQCFHTLVESSDQYAKAALDAAQYVLELAIDGGTMGAAYTGYADIGKFLKLSQRSTENADSLMLVLSSINDCGDDEANEAYASHLIDMSRASEISAIVEATQRRLLAINDALPMNPQAGARFDPSKFAPQEPDS